MNLRPWHVPLLIAGLVATTDCTVYHHHSDDDDVGGHGGAYDLLGGTGGVGGSGGSGPATLDCDGTTEPLGPQCADVYQRIVACCADPTFAHEQAKTMLCELLQTDAEALCQSTGDDVVATSCSYLQLRPECQGGAGGAGGGSVLECDNPGGQPCADACHDLYACAQQGTHCPGLADTTQQEFLCDERMACLALCAENPSLISLVNPADCSGTIHLLLQIYPPFEDACLGTGW